MRSAISPQTATVGQDESRGREKRESEDCWGQTIKRGVDWRVKSEILKLQGTKCKER